MLYLRLRQKSLEDKLVGTAGFESHPEKPTQRVPAAVRIYLYPQKYPQISRDDHSRARALVSRQLGLSHHALDRTHYFSPNNNTPYVEEPDWWMEGAAVAFENAWLEAYLYNL